MTLMAARRDASFYHKPGRAWRFHIVVDTWGSACNRSPWPHGMLLTDFTACPAAEVPEHSRCQRPGCRVRWPEKEL